MATNVAMPLPTKITIEQPLKVKHVGVSAQFGYGREQRAPLGTNRKRRSYSIEWAPLSLTEKNTVTDTLDSVEGYGILLYTACNEATQYKYKLVEGSYDVQPLKQVGLYKVTCQIDQVF